MDEQDTYTPVRRRSQAVVSFLFHRRRRVYKRLLSYSLCCHKTDGLYQMNCSVYLLKGPLFYSRCLEKLVVSKSFSMGFLRNIPSKLSALAKIVRPRMVGVKHIWSVPTKPSAYEIAHNQWVDRTLIHPSVGSVKWFVKIVSDSLFGCISAYHPIR